jgi:hypothetical protein
MCVNVRWVARALQHVGGVPETPRLASPSRLDTSEAVA